jgi:prevent-host-death family protein
MNEAIHVTSDEFKSKCLELMEQVHATKTPLVVTAHGKPLVTILPLEDSDEFPFGYMKGRIKIHGDIVGPTGVKWNDENYA